MELRDYQISAVNEVYTEWKTAQNVCLQLATGAGKTACLAYIMMNHSQPSLAIAHRTELVSQMSLTLAQYGVRHNIIAPKATVREIITLHMTIFGESYYDPQAIRYVAGVLTLLNHKFIATLAKRITLIVFDEAHHVIRGNTWGKVADIFKTARGLFVTATPQRGDGKGLGRHADGVIDRLVVGVSMRELITQGYLTPYRIYAPPNALDLSSVTITASGEYSPPKLRRAVNESRIVGNVVEHYKRLADGELGITFAVDIDSCIEIVNAYRKAGIPAEMVNAKTPALMRATIMRRFRNKEILQLVNVDILGEGVDVPAVKVVSMCRPTASYNVHSQQFGRMMRPSPGKDTGILIDHVGNTVRHGLPDANRNWTLDRRERRSRSVLSDIPVRVCLNLNCVAVYPRTLKACPYCGHYPEPVTRATPEQVDGDLTELDEETLARMRGEIARIDGAVRVPQGISTIAQLGIAKNHKLRQDAQHALRSIIDLWAGYHHEAGKSDSEIHRLFYFRFGVDILTAQTYGVTEANKLIHKLAIDNPSTNS